MENHTIRPVALCVFRKGGSILVKEEVDPLTLKPFYRPLGGEVAFGEYSWEAIRREIKSEIGEDIKNLSFIGPTENIYDHKDGKNHELIFLFEGEFINRAVYKQEEIPFTRQNGHPLKAVWKPMDAFVSKQATLYPEGLLEFLMN